MRNWDQPDRCGEQAALVRFDCHDGGQADQLAIWHPVKIAHSFTLDCIPEDVPRCHPLQ